jgi:hypothetical protein
MEYIFDSGLPKQICFFCCSLVVQEVCNKHKIQDDIINVSKGSNTVTGKQQINSHTSCSKNQCKIKGDSKRG